MPKVFRQPETPRGWWIQPPPWIFAFPSEFLENISHWYVFGAKESNGDNEKILSLLHDLENQGQTPICMTAHISGCKQDTKLILVSILTFSRSKISKMLKAITCSISRMRLLDLSRPHGNTIISLPFFEIRIGFQ